MFSSEDKCPGEVVRISYQETEAGLRLGDTQESLNTGPLLIISRGNFLETVECGVAEYYRSKEKLLEIFR